MRQKMRKLLMGLTLAAMLCVGVVSSAYAKFWGWQTTETTDWADGQCAYRQICRVHYVFWIAGAEECTTITVVCLER